MPDWLSSSISKVLAKAERNLDTFLDLETKESVVTPTGEVVMRENINLLRIKADASKFVAERLGRKKYGQTTSAVAMQINV